MKAEDNTKHTNYISCEARYHYVPYKQISIYQNS